MGFFSSIGHFLAHPFGLGEDDDEKRRRQQQQQLTQQRQAPLARPGNNFSAATPQPSAQPGIAPENKLNLVQTGNQNPSALFGTQLKKPQPQQTPVEQKLDELYKSNLPQARKEANQGESWFSRNFLNRGAIEQRAESTARRRATTQYQEQNGYNRNPDVLKYSGETLRRANQASEDAAASTRRLDKFAGKLNTTMNVAGNIPVVGSILKLESAGLQAGANAVGAHGVSNQLEDARTHLSLGMSNDEFNKLDDEQKRKLGILRTADTALSPLDFFGLTGLVKAPVVQGIKQGAKEVIRDRAISTGTKDLIKLGAKEQGKQAAVGFGIGTGVSAGGQQWLSGNVDPLAAFKGGVVGSGIALLTPGGALKKAPRAGKPPVATGGNRIIPEPDEVSAGIKSVNPKQAEDAAEQAVTEAAHEGAAAVPTNEGVETTVSNPGLDDLRAQANDTDVPAFQRRGAKQAVAAAEQAATDQNAINLGAGPTALDTPTFQFKQDVQGVLDDAEQQFNDYVNENQGISQQELEAARESITKQAQDRIAAMQARRAGSTIEATTPEAPTPAVAVADPLAASPAPAAAPVEAATPEPAAVQTPAAGVVPELAPEAQAVTPTPAPTELPGMPQNNGQMVDVAPKSHDALVKSLGNAAQPFKGKYSQRESADLETLRQNASAIIANMDDQQLLAAFQTTSPDEMVRDGRSLALARAAADRFAQHPEDPAQVQAMVNIMDSLDRAKSTSGEILRIAQEEFDKMPIPMKVRYLVKKIDAANRETKNYTPLADDPAAAVRVENELTYQLTKAQGVADRVSQLEGRLTKIFEDAQNGVPSTENINDLRRQINAERRELLRTNGDVVKYFDTLVPGRTKAQKVLSDFPRTMMLASMAGRVNDVLTTANNVAHLSAVNVTHNIIGKAVNLIKGRGTVSNTMAGTGRLFSGALEGAKRTGGEVKGNLYVDDIGSEVGNQALKKALGTRTGMQRATNPVARTVQAATEFATNLSEGVKDQRLYQLALQEADQTGVPRELREQYASARALVPSRNMLDKADQLHMEVNNLNDNPITRGLNRFGAALEGDSKFARSGVGGFLKNQVVPFTSWLGGNIWNSVTDRNVVASAVKLIGAAGKRDPELIVRQTAKTINGAGEAYALGYLLTQAGLLTNQNAEGYNDDGAYLHVGDRYIPVGFFGAFAPNIILGNAAFHGLNDPDVTSPSDAIVRTATTTLGNAWQSLNATSALGQDNNLSRSYDAAGKADREGGITGEEGQKAAGATFASGSGGQFLPGLFGDVNAVLNNQDSLFGVPLAKTLNPTHEAADTKAINPNSPSGKAKDYGKTAINQFLNRIPGVSQLAFPRKAGVAANDMVDRVTRGDRDTAAGKQARADEKTAADRAADFKARGIPDPYNTETGYSFNDAVTNAADQGKFDSAIEGLNAKMKQLDGDSNATKEQKQKVKDQISEYQVLKDGGWTTDDYDLYKSVSVSDWRKLGDPDSEYYDKDMYEALWAMDAALAKKGVGAGRGLREGKQKYSAKKSGGGSGGRGGVSKRISSNTIGSLPDIGTVSFGNLVGRQTGSPAIPTIAPIRADQPLIKARKITVSR